MCFYSTLLGLTNIRNTFKLKKIINRIRIIGLIMLIIGIILQLSFENDGTDFLSGFFVFGGIALFITGKIKSKRNLKL